MAPSAQGLGLQAWCGGSASRPLGISRSRRLPPKCQLFREPGLGYHVPVPRAQPALPLQGLERAALCPRWLCLPLTWSCLRFSGCRRPPSHGWAPASRGTGLLLRLCFGSFQIVFLPVSVHSLDLPLNWLKRFPGSLLGEGNNDSDMCAFNCWAENRGRVPFSPNLCPTRVPCFLGSSTQLVKHRAGHGDPSGQL